MEEAIRLQSVSDSTLSEAVRLTLDYALRAPDAIHLAAAVRVKAAIPDAPFYFLTSDARLKVACESRRLAVLDPEATGSMGSLRDHRRIE